MNTKICEHCLDSMTIEYIMDNEKEWLKEIVDRHGEK